MFWWILFSLITVFGVVSIIVYCIKERKGEYLSENWFFAGLFCLIIGFICLICSAGIVSSYNTFERVFEIQRETLEIVDVKTSDVTYITDILENNMKLAEYKASNEIYGFFSFIPDRVQNIVPLGVEMPKGISFYRNRLSSSLKRKLP